METDPQYPLPLLKPPDVYESFGVASPSVSSMRRREIVIAGLHHLTLNAAGLRRFPLMYTLGTLEHATLTEKSPHDPDALRTYAHSSDAFYVMQRTEKQFEDSIRSALAHGNRPDGTLSGLQMKGIFNLGNSTMKLILDEGRLDAHDIADNPDRPQWAIPEKKIREFYTWHRPEGYPEYPAPLELIR